MEWFNKIRDWFRNSEYDAAWAALLKEEQENPYNLKNMQLQELCSWIGRWPTGSANRLIGEVELRRRESEDARRLSRKSLAIAVGSFIVAWVSLIYSIAVN